MAVLSLPVYRFFYQGAPASNGTITVYTTGTTTPVTIYTNAALSVPASNPITLDSNGECKFYVGTSTTLRLDVKNSGGTLIESLDPCSPAIDLSVFSGTGSDLNKIAGITNGTQAPGKALVTDTNGNVGNVTTETANTASTRLANMAAVQNSMTGGFINKFRNPGPSVWQRGTGITIIAASPAYGPDGWIVGCTGANIAITRFFGLSTGSPYSLGLGSASGTTDVFVKQRLASEDVGNAFNAKTLTFQVAMQNQSGASVTPTITVKYPTATDNYASTTIVVNAASLQPVANATQAVLSYTFTNAAQIFGLEVTVDFGNALNGTGKNIYLSDFDLRVTPGVTTGLNSAPPTFETRPFAIEYPLNRRLLPARLSSSTTDPVGSGMCITTTTAKIVIPFDTLARISPTGITISAAGDFSVRKNDGTLQVCTGLTFVQASLYCCEVLATVGSAVLTAGNATELISSSATGSIIFTGAEL